MGFGDRGRGIGKRKGGVRHTEGTKWERGKTWELDGTRGRWSRHKNG